MGRKMRKYSKLGLFFKLALLLQLYCYHSLEVGAVPPRQENMETCDECHANHNGTYFEEESEKDLQKSKRPARLIPLHYFS